MTAKELNPYDVVEVRKKASSATFVEKFEYKPNYSTLLTFEESKTAEKQKKEKTRSK